jgi:hypothetical protein
MQKSNIYIIITKKKEKYAKILYLYLTPKKDQYLIMHI